MLKHLHLFKTLFLLLAIVAGGNLTANAADETITFSELGLTNQHQYESFSGSTYGLNFDLAFGDGSNDGKYYNTGAAIRVYGGGHMTVSSTTKNIAKIELTFGSGDGSNAITANVGTYESGTWTGNAKSVTFTVGGSNGHRRIASVAVTYYTAVKSPVISPADGTTFTGTQSVTITQADSKPVYYTTDGSTPTKSSTPYTAAFNVNASAVTGEVTVKAIAYDGEEASSIVSATYTDTSIQPTLFTVDLNYEFIESDLEKNMSAEVEKTVKNTKINIWKNSGTAPRGDADYIRLYNGSYLKITAPAGYTVNNVEFDHAATWADPQVEGVAITDATWAGDATEVEFDFTGTSFVKGITITLAVDLPVVATLANTLNVSSLNAGATGTFSTTVTPAAGLSASDYTLGWAVTPAGLTVDADNGAYTAVSRGTYTVTATATSTNPSYKNASKKYTVTVSAPVEVTASNVEMTYGDAAEAIGATASAGYAGTLSYVSANPAVATVDASGNVTAVAAGTTTITITSAADAENLYLAGTPVVINVTVNAPAGGTTALSGSVTLFHETFGSNSSTRAWNNSYSEKSGVSSVYSATTYTVTSASQSSSSNGFGTGSGLWQSTTGTDASIIIGPLNVAAYKDMTLTYKWRAGSIKGNYSTTASYATSSTSEYTELAGTGAGATTFVDRTYSLPAAAQVSTLYLKIVFNTSNTNAVIDEIDLSSVVSLPDVTLNSEGYATICSEYPLDFTDYETADYSAWQVTGAADNKITFTQVTGTVKGGTGLLLKGDANATVTLKSSNSSTTLSGNKLVGTLAPTYIDADQYLGLKGKTFVPVNAGTVKAGKALLPVSAIGSSVRELTFVFEDGGTTGINNVNVNHNDNCYDLQGRRVAQPTKGLYIVNGKKVVIK